MEVILEQLLMRTADFAEILANFSLNVLVKKGSYMKKKRVHKTSHRTGN